MAICKILEFPADKKILLKKSESIQKIDDETKQLVQNLKDTLASSSGGIGLSAPQIGVLKKVIVFRKLATKNDIKDSKILCLINPKIISAKGSQIDYEGCLSIPKYHVNIERSRTIKVRAKTLKGERKYEKYTNYLAKTIQHEIDHLSGLLIINHPKQRGKPVRGKKFLFLIGGFKGNI